MLTLQYIPHSEINSLTSTGKIKKLLSIVKSEKIILMEGNLTPEEETNLIEKTMEIISKTFKGIEICTVNSQIKNIGFATKIKQSVVKWLVGHPGGLTIIGPATIVKEIKRDPTKIELLTSNSRRKRRK